MLTVSFFTQGCRANQSETSALKQSLISHGIQVVPFEAPCDIVVINTCTVTEKGDADTRRLIARLRREKPGTEIVLIGCQVETLKESLLEIPGVKGVIGNQDKMKLGDILLNQVYREKALIEDIQCLPFTHDHPAMDTELTRANLKIQDGCNNFCAYCIVPYVRGRARSREYENLLAEVDKLLSAGYREIVLTGINIGNYLHKDKALIDVIKGILSRKGDFRLRISSIEPHPQIEEIVTLMEQNPRLCRFLHIPVQSGCDTLLTLMGRRYTTAEFSRLVLSIHKRLPDCCIGTDVIVGFPGETKSRFDETRELFKNLPLAYFHVFSYSERPGVKSLALPEKVDAAGIKERSAALRALSTVKRKKFMERFLNQKARILFEEEKQGYWFGLTDNYMRVMVKTAGELRNRFETVLLEKISGQNIIGTFVHETH